MEDNQFPREISLCLSGGAAKGAFHLGVISILQQQGIKIKAVSGTSIGALIGASLASGKSAETILEVIKSKAFKKIFKLHLGKGYLYKVDMDNPLIKTLLNVSTFEELQIPFELALTNIDTAEVVYKNSGAQLHEYVLASCSIVPIIGPQEIGLSLYTDGGLIDNFPVERLKKYPYKILGINLHPHISHRPTSILGWIKQVVYITWQAPNLAKRKECDYYISSDLLQDINMFSFNDIDKAYALGQTEMKKILQIRER